MQMHYIAAISWPHRVPPPIHLVDELPRHLAHDRFRVPDLILFERALNSHTTGNSKQPQ